MLTVHSVSEAAELAALLAWICASGFLVFYAWDLRRVFQAGHASRPRRGRPELFSFHLVVVHNDPAVDLRRTLGDLVETFPQARVWAIAGAAEIDQWAPEGSRWQVIPAYGTDPLVRVRDTIASELPPAEDPRRVVIGLLESGSLPAPDLLDRLAARGLLADRRIGGVQLARRVGLDAVPTARRSTPSLTARTLLWVQDLEERGPVSAAQLARSGNGTAILGGTGQFYRLSALSDALSAPRPKSGPTSRDLLDGHALTTGLWAASWSTAYADDTAITRRGTSDVRAYIEERRQLALAAFLGLGELVGLRGRSRGRSAVSLAGPALAPLAYLLATIITVLAVIGLAAVVVAYPGESWTFLRAGGWAAVLALAVIAFGEFIVWGLAYGLRCEPELGPVRGVGLGAAYVALGLAQALAVWAAATDAGRIRFGPAAAGGGARDRRGVRSGAPDVPPRTVEPGPAVTRSATGGASPWTRPSVGVAFASDSAYALPEPALLTRRRTDVATAPTLTAGTALTGARRVRSGVAPDAPADQRQPVAGSGRHRA